jgi:hypothetical protein
MTESSWHEDTQQGEVSQDAGAPPPPEESASTGGIAGAGGGQSGTRQGDASGGTAGTTTGDAPYDLDAAAEEAGGDAQTPSGT